MLHLRIITPERVAFTQEIYEAIVPTNEGEIAILPGHIPIISLLKLGVVSIRHQKNDSDNQMEHIAIRGGFLEMDGKNVKIMADTAIKSNEVDELEVQAARQRAQNLKDQADDDISLADATALLEQSIMKIKLVDLKKKRHQSTR